MKKFLCVLLTLTMLLSSMVVITSAAKKGESNTEVIWISNCDTTAGNKGIAGYVGIDKDNKTEGEGSILIKRPAGTHNPGVGLNVQFGFEPGLDVSKASYVYIDMYISDASVLSGNLHWELTSSGGPDVEESMYPGVTLKDGWNTLEIPLALFGGNCDFTRFNYMRMFNCVPVKASEELVVRVDNIRFECGDKISFNAFSKNDTYFIGTDGGVGNADWGKFADGTGKILYAFEVPSEKVPYVENIKVCTTIRGSEPAMLVSSNGIEWKTVFANTSGNSSVYVDVTSAIDFNKSNILYVAIADADTSDGFGGQMHNGTQFDVLISYTDVQARGAAEYYNFKANSASEDAYCIQKEGKTHDRDPYRYHDNGAKSVWKYVLADATELQAINYTVRMAANGSKGGLLLQVSLDNKEWTDVHVGGADKNNSYTFNLMKFIDVEALQAADVPTIYIRMGDATPDNGWGGQIWFNVYTTLAVVHTPPPANGIVGMVDRIFTEFKILSKIPFLSRLFKSAKPVA